MTSAYDFSPRPLLAPHGSRESHPSLVDLRVEHARPALAAALRAAVSRGVVAPTAFLARVEGFAGLAFAREVRAKASPGVPIVGCDARNVVACALLAVDNDACRAFLGLDYDWEEEVPLVLLDGRIRVVTLSRAELMYPPEG